MNHKSSLTISLFLFALLEVWCQVIGIHTANREVISLLYFFSGCGVAILPMLLRNLDLPDFQKPSKSIFIPIDYNIFQWFSVLFLLGIAIFMFQWVPPIFQKYPLDYKSADMLPIIQIMGERWLQGAKVYEIIPFWEGTEAIYLPAMWMPYLPAIAFGIDLRWAGLLALLSGVFFICFLGNRKVVSGKIFLIFIPILLIFYGLFYRDAQLIYLSEETVVIAYYLLLAYSISQKNPYLIGIAIACCWMSRFALVYWSMMYFAYLFFYNNKIFALKTAFTAVGLSLVLLIETGAIWQLETILGLPEVYLNHVVEYEWKVAGLLQYNLGLAKFFTYKNLPLVHQLFMIGNIVLPAFCLYLFWRFKNKLNTSFFAICSLKLCVVFFYNMLIMPFGYLFYTSTFLSVGILSWALRRAQGDCY